LSKHASESNTRFSTPQANTQVTQVFVCMFAIVGFRLVTLAVW
jgi:hypothetical protein